MDRTPKRGNREKTPDSTENVETSPGRAPDPKNRPIRLRNMDRTPKRGNREKTPDSTENVETSAARARDAENCLYVEQTWTERQNVETGQNARLRGKRPN